MGYVAVKGGTKAIEASIERLKYERLKGKKLIEVETILHTMRGLVDHVMSEASLYAPELAALAIKQAEGNIEESVFLLRAYRSTLPRKHYTNIIEPDYMKVERRISASFKDIVGGQILGASYDYTHRLIDFSLIEAKEEELLEWLATYENDLGEEEGNLSHLPKVVEYLRKENLLKNYEPCDDEPRDITQNILEFPTTRAERLQALSRGQSSAVIALGYSALRSCGISHPTVGELRVGQLPITVASPLAEESEEEAYYIGAIKTTEVEMLVPVMTDNKEGKKNISFEVGYGICYGQNETKAIAMSILDYCLEEKNKDFPTGDEEFVLMSIDSVESTGFISHLKLPHYVTFQSELNSVRKTHKEGQNED